MRCSCLTLQCSRALGLLLLALTLGADLHGGQKEEETHRARFAPAAEKLRSAERSAQARVQANPNDAKAWLDLGMAHLRLSRVEDAIGAFRRAAGLAPSVAEPQTDLAYALWMHGDVEGALVAARAALVLDPNDASAHRYAGRLLLLHGGDSHEALEHLEKAAKINPAETDAHFDLAMAYRAAGDAASAWAQLRLLQIEFPENEPRVLYVQGVLVSEQGRSGLAINYLRQAMAGDPHLPGAREALGVELARSRQWAEAADLLAPAVRDNPRSFQLTYAYALTLMNTQHLAEAEAAAKHAVDLNPQSLEARTLLGQIQARLAPDGGK